MLRIVIALVMGAHGIGHLIGVVGALRPGGMTWGGSSESWLLTPMLGHATAPVEALLYGAATIGWVLAAGLLFGGYEAWRSLAIGSAVVSLLAIGLFPQQLTVASMLGAVAVNAVALVGLLMLRWPGVESIGA